MDDRVSLKEIPTDDLEWRDRSEYWRAYRKPIRGAPKKFNYREPLILCGHGVRIKVDHNTLLIRNGFTHYPQKTDEIRFFPGDANLPDRIIILDGSGGMTFDALNWMSEQQIDFVRLDWQGKITNVGGISGYAGNSKLNQAQRSIKGTKVETEIARHLITQKIEASIKTLKSIIPKSECREIALDRLYKQLSEIQNARKSFSISRLLGFEGASAAAYFAAWQGLPIKWSGLKRKPAPDNWLQISPRTMTWRKGTRNARHPVNAMLNYGYGMLANQMRTQVIAAGLDPTIGIIHGTSKNRIPLVYDLMEPLRPVVDRQILEFVLSHTFTPGDFAINNWGGCRLNPQMAKVVANHTTGINSDSVVKHFLRSF
jgi:CRISPR-associated protein Cas1